jgi:hypothetical protein
MTVEVTDSRERYATDGTSTTFAIGFYFLANSHLQVVYTDSAGAETTLTLTTDYSVTGAGDENGGSITTVETYASGGYITIVRNVPITQLTDYVAQDAFPAESHEAALDKLTMVAQQQDELLARSLSFPVSDPITRAEATLPITSLRLDRLLVFDDLTGLPEMSTITQTQLASAVAAAYAAGSTADAVSYINAGTGAVSRTVQSRLRDIVVDDDFGTFAQAKTRADAALLPLLADPTVNLVHEPPLGGGEVPTNGYMRKGLMLGHMTIGNGPAGIDAMVGIRGDEYYTNVEQEVRGVSFVVRNTRTTPDESTLGWDFFGVVGVVTVEAGNTQNLLGNHKAVTGELYFNSPTSGSYTVTKAHNFQASAPEVGANVTVTNWYGLVVNSPTGSGAITTGYGLYIEAISLPTNKAAIRINGQADAGQIMWPNTSIKELATNKLQIDLGACLIFEDSSNRLNLSLNTQQLILNDALVATTVGASGAASALPAQPAGYWRVNIGGITRKIPYYTD